MKSYLPVLVLVLLNAVNVSAQNSTAVQAGASTQIQTSAQASQSGAKTSGNASTSNSATASANAGNNSAQLSSDTKVNATLQNTVDVKKNKPGDRVEARTTQDVKQGGQVVLRKGTVLVGHVTEATARTKDKKTSQLGIVFDHAVMKGGQQVPFHASIQALASAQSSTATAIGSDSALSSSTGAVGGASSSAQGGLLGGASSVAGSAGSVVNTATSATGNVGGAVSAVSHSTGSVGGLTSTGQLTSNSSGVFGLDGLSINSAASSATQGSMIVSPTQNVRLGSGIQMLLNASGQAQ